MSSGNTTLGGQQMHDLFHPQAGHTLTIASGQVLRIDARIVLIEGTIAGTAAGHAAGSGPGVGAGSSTAGGNGGYDSNDTLPAGGAANGNATDATVQIGSGGGSTDNQPGGAGGGGGRIKVLHTRDLSDTSSRDVSSGAGGLYGDVASGQAGAPGSSHTGTAAGVEPDVTVSPETSLF